MADKDQYGNRTLPDPAIVRLETQMRRMEAIARANRLHEETCAHFIQRDAIRNSPDPGMPMTAQCDCWLSEGS